MRLLAVGDLHGDTALLLRLLEELQPDGLLGVGDWGDPGQIPDATWSAILNRVPTLTVFGNHDNLPALSRLRNTDDSAVLLGQGETRSNFCGLTIAGVSGIWAKSHRLPHYVTDEDVAGWAAVLAAGPPIDILLTHGCPLGVADRTPSGRPGGQRCFLDLLTAVHPRFYLCGHLHVTQQRKLSELPTTVFNIGALPQGHYVEIIVDSAGISAVAIHSSLAGSSAE